MKKLIFASILMLASMTACQNENSNDEFVSPKRVENASKKTFLKYVSPSEVYINDVRLIEETGKYADIVSNIILHPEVSRSANIQCSFKDQENGTIVYLTQVYGDGAPSTYWISYVHADGSISTYPNPGYPCSAFAAFYP